MKQSGKSLSLKIACMCTAAALSIILVACGSGGLRWNSQLYRVSAGETLYAIAWRYNLDYRELARWNNIPAPYIIRPGQELLLMDPALGSPGGRNSSRPCCHRRGSLFLPQRRRPRLSPAVRASR
jgi:hypothetical protein